MGLGGHLAGAAGGGAYVPCPARYQSPGHRGAQGRSGIVRRARRASSSVPPVTRTFAMADVVRQYRELADEPEGEPGFVYDTLIVGGGAAGAGVLRDLASRGNASAILVDRGSFGGETSSKTGKAIHPGIRYLRMAFHRLLLAFHLRKDPKIKQTSGQNLRGAWL